MRVEQVVDEEGPRGGGRVGGRALITHSISMGTGLKRIIT